MTNQQPNDSAQPRLARIGAPTLYFLGVLWLAAMAFVAAWPDMEASVFDAGTSAATSGRLRLRCPWVMAADEVATIGLTFKNDTDRTEKFLVRTRISRGFVTLVHEDSQQMAVEPGESTDLEWPVKASDAAYGRLVLGRVLATRSASSPARDGACGVFVVGLTGVNGNLLFVISVVAGLALTAAGAGWWWRVRRPLDRSQTATARRTGMLAVIVIASLLTGMLGWWLPSHILLIAAGLFVFMVLERTYANRK